MVWGGHDGTVAGFDSLPAHNMEKKTIKRRKKVCTCCGQKKWLREFYKTTRGYYHSICKDCARVKARERYKKKTGVMMHNGRLMYISGRTWKLYWTGDMLSVLRKHHANTSDKELGEMIGVSKAAVSKKAKELGLVKSEAYKKDVARRVALGARVYRMKQKKQDGIHIQMD